MNIHERNLIKALQFGLINWFEYFEHLRKLEKWDR